MVEVVGIDQRDHFSLKVIVVARASIFPLFSGACQLGVIVSFI